MKLNRPYILTALLLLLLACGERTNTPKAIDPAFTNYISAFTGWVITNRSTIKIQLTESVRTAVAGQELNAIEGAFGAYRYFKRKSFYFKTREGKSHSIFYSRGHLQSIGLPTR